MSTVQLVKHHGFGNDFLIGFHVEGGDAEHADLARAVCDRRRGVGADGLLLGDSDPAANARMTLYNTDGSRAEMSGNGIRCFAHALLARRGELTALTINTDAGLRTVELEATDDPHTLLASVGMGAVSDIAAPAGWDALGADAARPVAHLSVGNPHTVVGVEDVTAVDLGALGAKLPNVNLEVIEAGPESHAISMRVHERGAGITEACGTGACAAAVAARRWGLATPLDGKLVVHMGGGSASVEFDHDADSPTPTVSLCGPTTYIATIEFPVSS
jgi:diaminopimelate epimerase